MTDPTKTAIAVVLDRSGSMTSIRTDAEGGLNEFVRTQRDEPGEATFTLVQFDDRIDEVHRNIPLADVPEIKLFPRGMTALYDALGHTINILGQDLAALDEDQRPGKVIVAIVTDGQENHSKEWNRAAIFDAIKRQETEWAWEFLYVSAGADAFADAQFMGIRRDHIHSYTADAVGTRSAYGAMGQSVSSYRGGGKATIDPGDG